VIVIIATVLLVDYSSTLQLTTSDVSDISSTFVTVVANNTSSHGTGTISPLQNLQALTTSKSNSSSSTGYQENSISTNTTTDEGSTTNSTKTPEVANSTGYWLTYAGGNSRDSFYHSVVNLTTPSIAWKEKVDAPVYSQPLYFSNTVFIATENNTVYALNSQNGSLQWFNHLGPPMESLVPPLECNNNSQQAPDIRPTIGITGTPVIDPVNHIIYVVTLIMNEGFVLNALNTATGQRLWKSSVNPPGFHYLAEEQRGALAFANGFVYVPFGGYSWDCVIPGPTGWLVAMPASNKGIVFSFNIPTTVEGDIWAPEGVSVSSSGSVYVVTGDSNNPTFDLGNSVIKLNSTLSFVNSSANFFTPSDWNYTNANDLDLGSTGATLLPGGLLFSIGKDGIGYLLNSSTLGGVGGEIYHANVCGSAGAWGATSYSQGIIFVPCADGIHALSVNDLRSGSNFRALWNSTQFWPGPVVITAGAVWSVEVTGTNLYALSLENGSILAAIKLGTFEHFTAPSAGESFVFVAANQTIYGIEPAG